MAEPTERIAILLELQQQEFEKRAKSAGTAIDRLERKFNPLAAAEAKLEKQQLRFNAALEAGTIDAAQHAKGMDLLQREYDQAADRASRLTDNVVAMNGRVASSTGFMHRNRQVFQQAGYQVGDFAVQVQGGTSAITAFTQQGTQMLGVFGAYGAVAGAVLAVGAPLISTFLNSGESAQTYGDAITELEKALQDFKAASDLAALSALELEERFGEGAEVLRGTILLLREFAMAQAITDAKAAAAALSEEYSDLFLNIERGGYAGRNAVSEMSSEFGLSKSEAIALKNALADIGAASGPSEISEAARQLNGLLVDIYGSAQAVPDEFRAMAIAAGEAALVAEELQGKIDDTRFTAVEMVDAMMGAATALGGAIPNADALLGRIQSLAKAAWDYAGAMGAAKIHESEKGRRGAVDPRTVGGGFLDWNTRDATKFSANYTPPRVSRSGGGSGGGSKAREQEPLFSISEKELEKLQRQIDMLGKSKGEIAELTVKQKLLDEAKKRGMTITEELTSQIEAEAAEVGILADKYDQARDKVAAMEEINASFKDSVIDAAMGGADAFDNFKDAIKRAAIEYALFGSGLFAGGESKSGGFGGILGGVFGGGSGGGFLGGLLSFDGGGNTGGGARTGGVDGKGGFPAILHPNETVVDHTKGQSTQGAQSLSVTVTMDPTTAALGAFVTDQAGQVVAQASPGIASQSVKQAQASFRNSKSGWSP